MKKSIQAVEEELAKSNVTLEEYKNKIREINWSYFDYAQDRVSQLTKETSFLIDLMSNSDLYDDRGQFNDTGLATLGMRAISYDTYMAQADEYAKEMQAIQKELATDPYNKTLIERRETLLGLQQESIKSAEAEKQAIKSLVEEGIKLELDALKELITEYEDSLDSAKDLYEYQKKISEQTANISSIQKQLAAYQNDTSEENRARVQKLQKDLESAKTTLKETEWEQSIAEQKKMLDDLYDDYEELLNERLDDIDELMRDMIDTANENSAAIRDEISRVASAVGYTTTGQLNTAMNGNVANYDGVFASVTGIHAVLNSIYDNVNAMARAAGAVKAYAKGGLIDYTGLAAVHGTPDNPEMVLSAADTEKFLQAAKIMQLSPALSLQRGADDLSLRGGEGGGGVSIGQLLVNTTIEHADNYDDLLRQMQADSKFERLVSAISVERLAGGSKYSKNKIVI